MATAKNRLWEKLAGLYEDAESVSGFASARRLMREARRGGIKVSRDEVAEFLQAYRSQTRFQKRKRLRIPTPVVGLHHTWQADLGFYPSYNKFTTFLVCIDVLSRFVYLRVLRNKNSRVVASAFEEILQEAGFTPSLLCTDRGTEFVGAPFQEVLRKGGISHFFAPPPMKAALCERVIRSLKESEGRLAESGRVAGGWPSRLRLAVRKYNAAHHSTIGMSPEEVTIHNAGALAKRLLSRTHQAHSRLFRHSLHTLLKLGSLVRIKDQTRHTFTKSNQPRNSEEIYQIGGLRLHPTGFKYKLFTTDAAKTPLVGSYYEFELVPVRVPQK